MITACGFYDFRVAKRIRERDCVALVEFQPYPYTGEFPQLRATGDTVAEAMQNLALVIARDNGSIFLPLRTSKKETNESI